jgi:hypothetical protein
VPDATDSAGQSFVFVRVAHTALYPRKALREAETAFRDHCKVDMRPLDTERIEVAVAPNVASGAEAREICLEFWNYALDLACQQRLEASER